MIAIIKLKNKLQIYLRMSFLFLIFVKRNLVLYLLKRELLFTKVGCPSNRPRSFKIICSLLLECVIGKFENGFAFPVSLKQNNYG